MQFNKEFAEQAISFIILGMLGRPLIMITRDKYGEPKYKKGVWDLNFVADLLNGKDIALRIPSELPWIWYLVDEECKLPLRKDRIFFLVYTDKDQCEKYVAIWMSLEKEND